MGYIAAYHKYKFRCMRMVLSQSTVKQCDTDTTLLKTATDWMVPMSLRNFQNTKWTKSIFWEDQSMLNFLLLIHPSKKL